MLDEDLLELVGGEELGLEKHWQWLYRVKNSPIWSITALRMTKQHFLDFMEEHNQQSIRNPIVEYGKAKITKRLFENQNKS